MITATPGRRRLVVVLLATAATILAAPASASAAPTQFFEQTAEAFWGVPHECEDGSTVPGTLLVRTTRDFEAPATEDDDPTARVQFLAVCPDGTSFSWAAPAAPATIVSVGNLRRVTATGSGIASDILGGTHDVTFDVTWTAVGPLEITVNAPGSKRKQRTAVATGRVTFDGVVLVDGEANHPTRPDPFIRIDIEK
jgi:hypothetical protein